MAACASRFSFVSKSNLHSEPSHGCRRTQRPNAEERIDRTRRCENTQRKKERVSSGHTAATAEAQNASRGAVAARRAAKRTRRLRGAHADRAACVIGNSGAQLVQFADCSTAKQGLELQCAHGLGETDDTEASVLQTWYSAEGHPSERSHASSVARHKWKAIILYRSRPAQKILR